MNDNDNQDYRGLPHTLQQVGYDSNGVIRFRRNAIVEYLLENGPFDMNHLAVQGFSAEDEEQFAQLIGYSVSGFQDLSYVSRVTSNLSEKACRALRLAKERGAPVVGVTSTVAPVTYTKVTDFPPGPGSTLGGEAMWVQISDGDGDDGIGWVANVPVVTDKVTLGSLISFGGGTDGERPRFTATLLRYTGVFGGPINAEDEADMYASVEDDDD